MSYCLNVDGQIIFRFRGLLIFDEYLNSGLSLICFLFMCDGFLDNKNSPLIGKIFKL